MYLHVPTLSLALAFFLADAASSQTLVVDNVLIAANTSTLAAAAEKVSGSDLAAENLQLTDAVISNLTNLAVTNISLFGFADESAPSKRAVAGECKTFPGDASWPDDVVWNVFDLLAGGALIETVPLASPCYDSWGNYDAETCAYITDQWSNSSLHETDPTSVMYPIMQGLTCIPSGQSGNCTLGGYPSWALNVTTVSQIQLAINFARNLNLRLVIKNTGHDFNGRSSGAGALSVWTHHLKGMSFYEHYQATNYSGPAIKAAAGTMGYELMDFADANGVVAVGGECRTVGWAGGYIAGGGHSPLSSVYGMAADQILSVDVVTPDGRFITANETQNTDLFWALRGGGGSTYGVVTSYTVKVYPAFSVVSYMAFSVAPTGNMSVENFWQAMKDYMQYFPTAVDAGNYVYWFLLDGGGFPELIVDSWLAPGMTTAELKNFTAPLFEQWENLGFSVTPAYYQYETFVEAYEAAFPQDAVGYNTSRAANRLVQRYTEVPSHPIQGDGGMHSGIAANGQVLLPRDSLLNDTQFDTFFTAFRQLYEVGASYIAYTITGGPSGVDIPDNAVNPAWRNAALYLIPFRSWASDSTWEEINSYSEDFTASWMPIIKNATVGSGGYASEGDVLEPGFKESFYGLANYESLLETKRKYDPAGLFYANKGVGSDEWYVTNQLQGLPTQNGRLCRA